LPKRGSIARTRIRRRIAAGTEQVRGLVIQPKRLHRSDHRSATSSRNEYRLLSHLARERTRQGVLKELEYPLRVAREQSRTERIQKRQHRDSVVFGVMYTL
jgi:hypothetical protein